MGEKVIPMDTGEPVMEGRGGYYAAHLIARRQFGQLLITSDVEIDKRIRDFVEFMITHIPDEKVQREYYTWIDDEIKRLNEIEQPSDNEERAKIERKVCIRALGKVTVWMDNFVGLVVKNVYGFVRIPDSIKHPES